MRSDDIAASSSPRRSGWPTGGSCRARGSFPKSRGTTTTGARQPTPETARTEYNDPNTDSRVPAVPGGTAARTTTRTSPRSSAPTRAPWDILRPVRLLLHVRSDVHAHSSQPSHSARADRNCSSSRAAASAMTLRPRLDFKLEKQFRVRSGAPARRDVRRFQPL